MKNLKIKDKLLIGILGQVTFIGLLLFFIFSLNNKLDSITLQRTENIKEVNMLRELSFLVKDFLANEITFKELQNDYSKIEQSAKKTSHIDEVQKFWTELNKVQQLKNENQKIENQISGLTEESLKQSNSYIENVSARLADISKRESVSTIERLVIAGANANNNTVFAIRVLFLKIKEDISNKNELIEFLDKAIEQGEADKEKLKNTQFAALPVNAINANLEIKKLALQFVENNENNNKIGKDITTSTNHFIEELNNEDLNLTKESFTELKSTIRNVFIILLVIAILIIVLNYSLSKIISFTFKQLAKDLTELSKGNLNVDPPDGIIERKDEIGVLGRSFGALVENLKRIVGSITTGANNVASASQQISSTTQQLSQGASEQASSTEEVSSSMEEMTSNIQQNTDNAQQTEKISISASNGVSKVATAARESLASIRQIAEKITIVNDIAFQTNILALNAAVEAARAGEHGKGFAVVAAEVRKLAERSKIAADEINELSRKSLKVTEDAGGFMAEIIPEIEKTAKLVQEISAASLEQNSGADQINGAIQQLSQVTQQNAAASEEMATSSEELASQADQLREIISYFKIEENNEAGISNKTSLQQFKPAKNKSVKPVGSNGGTIKKELESKGFDLKLAESNKIDQEFESY